MQVDEAIKGVDSRDKVKRNERSDHAVIFREDDVGGRARVTTDDRIAPKICQRQPPHLTYTVTLFQISSKLVHFRRSYCQTREDRFCLVEYFQYRFCIPSIYCSGRTRDISMALGRTSTAAYYSTIEQYWTLPKICVSPFWCAAYI